MHGCMARTALARDRNKAMDSGPCLQADGTPVYPNHNNTDYDISYCKTLFSCMFTTFDQVRPVLTSE